MDYKFDKVVHGHEGWMEDYVSHSHTGDPIMAMLKWGHNAITDGVPNMDIMTYRVVAPENEPAEVTCEMGDEDCLDLTSFDTYVEGYYTFIADYDNCWAEYSDEDWRFGDATVNADAKYVGRYKQYASITVPVGHFHATELPAIDGMDISILPTTGSGYMVSHEILFKAQLKGEPLANTDVLIVRLLDDGTTAEKTAITNEEGILQFIPQEMGTYVIIIRAKDKIPSAEGKYDNTNYTATHSFRVAEHNHNSHHEHGHHHEECEHHHDHSDLDELLEHDHEHDECGCGHHHHDHDHEHHHDHDHEHHHDHDHKHEHHHH